MNKTILHVGFCILAILLFSCNDEGFEIPEKEFQDEIDWDKDYPYDFIKDGTPFARANTVRFYFIDGDGNGLIISPDDLPNLPIACDTRDQPATIPVAPDDYSDAWYDSSGFYYRNPHSVYYDSDEKMYYWGTCAYGNASQHICPFYVAFKGEFIKMDVTYRYTDQGVVGGKYYAGIMSWKVNDVHVYSDNDGWNKKVFIKKVDGKTTVSLKK